MKLRVRRVKVYNTGMRVVEAALHHRVELWAQCYNTQVTSYDDYTDTDWIIVSFPDARMSSLFALSFDSQLGIESCT
jgi:hypothetical protein